MLPLLYALLTTPIPCNDLNTFFSQHTGACFQCMPPRQYFNGTCAYINQDITAVVPTPCPAGQISQFNNICLACPTCVGNTCPVNQFMIQTATNYVCGDYNINNLKTPSVITCPTGQTLNVTLNLCVSDALKASFGEDSLALCAMKVPQGCNLAYNECILSNDCTSYDKALLDARIESDVYLPRQVDLQNYSQQSFTSAIAPLPFYNGYVNKLDQQLQWTGKTFLSLQNALGEEIYNGPFFEGALSPCNLIKAQTNTISSFYGNRNVNIPNSPYTSILTPKSFHSVIKPIQQAQFNEIGTKQIISCKIPSKSLYDFLQAPLFASLYVLTSNNKSFPVPILINHTERLYFTQPLNLTTDTKFTLGHITSPGNFTFASQIHLDFNVDLPQKIGKLPVLRVVYEHFQVANFSLNYVQDQSPITAFFSLNLPSNSYQTSLLKIDYFSMQTDHLMPVLGWICFAGSLAVGVAFGVSQAGKHTGNGGNYFQQRKSFKYFYSEAERGVNEKMSVDFVPILIILVYIVGYVGIGLCVFSICVQVVIVVQRNFAYINGLNAVNLPEIQLAGSSFLLVFMCFRYGVEACKKVVFQDAQQAEMTGSNVWRVSLLVNKTLEIQKYRPYSIRFTVFLSMVLLFCFDMYYLSTGARNYGRYSTIDISFMPLIVCMIFSVCFFFTFLTTTVYKWFFQSKFVKFQQILSVFGYNCFVFDMKRSFLVIKGQSLVEDYYTPKIENVASVSQFLHASKIKQQSFTGGAIILRIFFGQDDILYESVVDYLNNITTLSKFCNKHPQYKITEKKVYGIQQTDFQQVELYNELVQQFSMIKEEQENLQNTNTVGYIQRFTDFKTIGIRSLQVLSYERIHTQDMVFKRDPLYKAVFGFRLWFYDFLFLNSCIYTFSYWTTSCFIGLSIAILLLSLIQRISQKYFKTRTCILNNIAEDFAGFF